MFQVSYTEVITTGQFSNSMGTENEMHAGFKEQLVLVHDQVRCVASESIAWHCYWFIIMHHFSL